MARVPLQNTPTEQLNPGSAVQFGATNVTPMQDVVSDDIANIGKAQKDAAQIAYAIQADYDDAKTKELFNEFSGNAMEIRNNYTLLEGKNAVEVVGKNAETNEPITVYDQSMSDLSSLMATFESRTDNKNQLEILRSMMKADTLLHQNAMSKHSLTEQKKYKDAEHAAQTTTMASAAGLEAYDWRLGVQIDGVPPTDKESNYWTRRIAALESFEELATSQGFDKQNLATDPPTFDSDQRIQGRQKVLTAIHDTAISNFLAKGDFMEAKAYLEYFEGEGEIPVELAAKHIKNINTGYNSQKSVKIVDSLFTNGDLSSNNFTNSFNFINGLNSSHAATDGKGEVKNGQHLQNGFFVEGNDINASQEILEKEVNLSKFHKDEGGFNLGQGHLTSLTFLTAKFGDVKKADAIFTKAKSELADGFDATKYGKDAQYTMEYDKKLLEKVNEIGIAELTKKFGDSDYANAVIKDFEYINNFINTGKTGSPFTQDAENGVANLNELRNHLKATIDNPELLKTAIAELESRHGDEVAAKEQEYKNHLAKVSEIAYQSPGNWKEIAKNDPQGWNMLKESDKKKLMKGPSKVDNVDLLIDLYSNPEKLFIGTPENPGFEQYRGDLTESTYLEMFQKIKAGTLGPGGGTGSGSTSVDKDVLDLKLKEYEFTAIRNQNNKARKDDYLQILKTWKDQVEDFKADGGKLDRQVKEQILERILNNRVMVSGGFNFGTGGGKEFVVAALDQDQLDKTYTIVVNPKDGLKTKIFHSKIPDEVRDYMLAGYERNGQRLSFNEMATRWVQLGMPRSKIDVDHAVNQQKGLYGKVDKL